MLQQAATPRRSRLFPEELPAQGQIFTHDDAPPRETGFGENFGAGFEEVLIAGNVGGPEHGLRTEYDRIIQALGMHGETARVETGTSFGRLPTSFNNPYDALHAGQPGYLPREEAISQIWAAVARQRRRDPNFLREMGTDRADLERIVRQRNTDSLHRIREVQAGATGWGNVGGFLGGAAGNLLDAGNLAALPTGGPGRSLLYGVARAGLNNMLVEAVEQPYVVGRYRVLGEAHDAPGELLTSIAGAGLFGGALHAGGRGAGALYDRVLPHLFESLPEPLQRRWADAMRLGDGPDAPLLIETLPHVVPPEAWTPDQRAAVHVLEREEELTAASPFEPSPAGDEAHAQRLAAAQRALEGGEPYAPPPEPWRGAVTRGTPDRGPVQAAPRRFASRVDAIVHLGEDLERQGLIVGENRHVGNRRFTPGIHQTGQAHGEYMIDVNDRTMPPGSPRIEARNPEVRARFDALARDAQSRGYRVLWNEHIYEPHGDGPGARIPGANSDSRQHRNHIHFEAPQSLVSGRTPGAHFGDRSLSAGIRNNNPGNLGDGELARGMPGYLGSDGRFAQFDTMEHGIAAQEELLRRRITGADGHGVRSIETLIRGTGHNDGYAPSERTGGDNPEAAVQSYIAGLAQALEKSPQVRLTEADIPRLAAAMRDREAPHWRDYLGAGAAPERAAAGGDGGEAAALEADALRAEADLAAADSAFDRPPVLRRDLFESQEAWAAAQRTVDAAHARGFTDSELADMSAFPDHFVRQEPGNGAPRRETGAAAAGQPAAAAMVARTPQRRAPAGPRSLVEFMQDRGGIVDVDGDLAAMGFAAVRGRARKGERKLIRDAEGSDASHMPDAQALAAWEAGYFPNHAERPTVRELYEAMGEDYAGRRVYTPEDAAELADKAALRARREQDDELIQRLEAVAAERELELDAVTLEDALEWRLAGVLDDEEAVTLAIQAAAFRDADRAALETGDPGYAMDDAGRRWDDERNWHDPAGASAADDTADSGGRRSARLRGDTSLSGPLGPQFGDLGSGRQSLRPFDDPDGSGAAAQAASLEHDYRMDLDAPDRAGESFRLDEEGEPRTLADIMAEVEAEEAAAKALRDCL